MNENVPQSLWAYLQFSHFGGGGGSAKAFDPPSSCRARTSSMVAITVSTHFLSIPFSLQKCSGLSVQILPHLCPYSDIWNKTCFWCNHSVNAGTPLSGVKS